MRQPDLLHVQQWVLFQLVDFRSDHFTWETNIPAQVDREANIPANSDKFDVL